MNEGLAALLTFAAVIAVLVSVLLAGGKAGEKQADKRWQAETVERGFAEYNAKTGQWQWKGSEVDGE